MGKISETYLLEIQTAFSKNNHDNLMLTLHKRINYITYSDMYNLIIDKQKFDIFESLHTTERFTNMTDTIEKILFSNTHVNFNTIKYFMNYMNIEINFSKILKILTDEYVKYTYGIMSDRKSI